MVLNFPPKKNNVELPISFFSFLHSFFRYFTHPFILKRFNVDGLGTNVNFLMDLAAHPAFAAGEVDTDFIPRHKNELFPTRTASDRQICEAAMAVVLGDEERAAAADRGNDPFGAGGGFRLGHSLTRKVDFVFGGEPVRNSNNLL